jgi:hypothetical protein
MFGKGKSLLKRSLRWQVVAGFVGVLLVSLTVVGCGGGGGGGIPGFSQGGAPYTPPENIMSTKEQTREVVREVVWALPIDLSPAEIGEELSEPWAPVEAVDSLFVHLGIVERTRTRAVTPQRFIAVFTKSWIKHPTARKGRQAQSIDWTDPETGVHWKGTYTETETETEYRISLNATGETEGTKITINISGRASEKEFSLSMGIEGTAPEDVWYEGATRRGVVRIWLSFSVSGSDTKGNGSVRYGMERSIPIDSKEVVVKRSVASGSLSYTVSGDQMTMTLKSDSTDSERIGEGLFWVRTQSNITCKARITEEEFSSVEGTVTASASNGMTASARINPDGTVNGWVKDDKGNQIGTISGNINTQIVLKYPDGTEEVIWS